MIKITFYPLYEKRRDSSTSEVRLLPDGTTETVLIETIYNHWLRLGFTLYWQTKKRPR